MTSNRITGVQATAARKAQSLTWVIARLSCYNRTEQTRPEKVRTLRAGTDAETVGVLSDRGDLSRLPLAEFYPAVGELAPDLTLEPERNIHGLYGFATVVEADREILHGHNHA